MTAILWPDMPFSLDNVVLIARRGSETHNTYVKPTDPNSVDDRDIYAVAVPPRKYYYGLSTWQHAESIKTDAGGEVWDVVVDEVRKFVSMLTKSNPNVCSMLWLRPEDYLKVDPAMQQFIAHRHLFLSKRYGFDAFAGYARAQFKKMQPGAFNGVMGDKRKRLVEKYGYDCKNAAHTVRLLHTGIELLREGTVNVWRTWDRDMLIDIKTGCWTLDKVKAYAEKHFATLQTEYDASKLQEFPDVEAIEQLLVDTVGGYLK